MSEIHCHTCGGLITDPGAVSYQPPTGAQPAHPHSALCACIPSVVHGVSPAYLPWPGLATLSGPASTPERRRAAAWN
jgi:hypothetical protein